MSNSNNKLKQQSYPWDIPAKKPARELSAAMSRLYDNYLTPRPEDNPLFTSFKYTELTGFNYHNNDGTISRRDPSKIIKVDGLYYVWYTKRCTQLPPKGAQHCNDLTPSTDWDLSEISYAISINGFDWVEQGIAVTRPKHPQLGWRSVSTPDILIYENKYYLYYQAFNEASGKKGDHCPVTLSVADTPDGPWLPHGEVIIENGEPGSWDQFSIHDPYLLIYNGKIHLYYKAAYGDRPDYLVGNGLATANNPFGPFEKHPLNPILNSGHETTYFPFKSGIAAFTIRNGNESNTIQYSPDGVNFSIAAVTSLMPIAAGPYVANAFDCASKANGIEWGLCHFSDKQARNKHSFLARFDCSLMVNELEKELKVTDVPHQPSVYFAQSLSPELKNKRSYQKQEKEIKSYD
ncbi:glycoside hydrolase [Pseudoalteromonas fuliginea]|uniref:Glycoside hydrolase n=1 Tax=Pseudoalteromonas fuliginea TaxID=1872678 RepID=A0AB73BDT1_9GAMM|nr:family 43 glycosylhydrolase [Pseudoalteromonas fuliginea]KAA1158104.1 glycoside hydrolase [Pseudoalteromonas fuliginea]